MFIKKLMLLSALVVFPNLSFCAQASQATVNQISNIALINAAQNGNLSEVKTLIQAGININAADQNGFTALMFASEYGHFEVVQTLIQAGADVTTSSHYRWTALMFASQNGYLEIVQTL